MMQSKAGTIFLWPYKVEKPERKYTEESEIVGGEKRHGTMAQVASHPLPGL
jgi:hypothetical protein